MYVTMTCRLKKISFSSMLKALFMKQRVGAPPSNHLLKLFKQELEVGVVQ